MAERLKREATTLLSADPAKRTAEILHLPTARGSPARGMQHGDARELVRQLAAETIDVTISSPPYFDLKDYSAAGQIGYGQSYEQYLSDLADVFGEIQRATKPHGSLWIVIDSFQRDQEFVPLPFDLASKLKHVGWSLRDVIIWKKERTLPWAQAGKTKRIFEYVLVLAKKGQSFRHFPDRLRDPSDLRRWWVKYPERYNPRGKALEEIWNFDIPVQGSWNATHVRHFCPLPAGLVGRIVELTTNPGDTVLDPFAGTGSVLAEAKRRGRVEIGFEINETYVAAFNRVNKTEMLKSTVTEATHTATSDSFEALIKKLRILKFARLLYRKLGGKNKKKPPLHRIFARRMPNGQLPRHKIISAEYCIHVPRHTDGAKFRKKITTIIGQKPLSKFGIQPTIRIVRTSSNISEEFRSGPLYGYWSTNSHRAAKRLSFEDSLRSHYAVVSPIRVSVEEPDD